MDRREGSEQDTLLGQMSSEQARKSLPVWMAQTKSREMGAAAIIDKGEPGTCEVPVRHGFPANSSIPILKAVNLDQS